MTRYPVLLFWDAADELWGADVPDVRLCSAHGETPEEAVRNVSEALADILADAVGRGIILPPPTERPVLAKAS